MTRARRTRPLAVALAVLGGSAPAVSAAQNATPETRAGQRAEGQYRPGQRVEARWRSGPDSPPRDNWDGAVMVEPGTDGSHLIRWDSNEVPQRVEAALIRPAAGDPALPGLRAGERVRACSGSYSCLEEPGVVTEVGQGPRIAMFRVRFDNGSEKWANGYSEFPASAGRSGPSRSAPSGSAPAGRRTAAARLPAAVPAGRYRCYLVGANAQYMMRLGGGVTEHQMVGYSAATGTLEVTGPTAYRFRTQTTTVQPGTFRYDPASGRITFGAGPYKPDQFRGEFGWNASDGKPVITLYGKSEKHGELQQKCLPAGAA